MIIIMRFGKYIDIYEFGGVRGGRTYSTVHFLFIIQKLEKVQEHDLCKNQILHHFDIHFFSLDE